MRLSASPSSKRARLGAVLRERLPALEALALDRIEAISDPSEVADPAYAEGLRSAVRVAIEYAIEVIERGEQRAPPPPPALLAQARMAARSGVGLDTVLRRYLAGYTLLNDFLGDAEVQKEIPGRGIADVIPGRGALLDRLLAAVSEEFEREVQLRPNTPEQRRGERVRRLLAGEPIDTSDLAYDFEGHHLALIAAGPGAVETMRELATGADCSLLQVPAGAAVWAWLGASRDIEPRLIERHLSESAPAPLTIAVGEPGQGLRGWRLSHRQAGAAMAVAKRSGQKLVRYGDVGLLAAVIGDELHAQSFHDLYIKPLAGERDGGTTLRETIRAYIDAEQNLSSAASALGVTRHTVKNRLRLVEERLGRPLNGCIQELHTALLVEELTG